jgi:hypothetical protein
VTTPNQPGMEITHNILGAEAAMEGLSDEERERLRFLAAFKPI